MYINDLAIQNFRTLRHAEIDFIHADSDFAALKMPAPKLPNVNLLLGNNGSGKTTVLKSIALSALGPAVGDSGIFPDRLVRREPSLGGKVSGATEAKLRGRFIVHPQDIGAEVKGALRTQRLSTGPLESDVVVARKGDLEQLRWQASASPGKSARDDTWEQIFTSRSDAFFFVGYGATRRVERPEKADPSLRERRVFARALRVMSLFEEDYSLVPLNAWLPAWKKQNPGRYTQVVHLLDRLIGSERYHFTGETEGADYLFERGGLKIPFRALSDGYRAYLGWICDLLYHVCITCPKGRKLVENRGIVMVDEIDLHLHPKWQMTVLPTLARALPYIQFIVTSHSPLIVGSLEWMNILLMKPAARQSSTAERIEWGVHGLDADQVLLTDFFSLGSTRAPGKKRALKQLALKARDGDQNAARDLLEAMSRGLEVPA